MGYALPHMLVRPATCGGAAVIPTTLDIARNLAVAWLPWLIGLLFIAAAVWTVRQWCRWISRWAAKEVERMVCEALDEATDDWPEPLPQTDAAADEEWTAILAAFGYTPEDMRAAYIDNACAELRRELDSEEQTW